MSEGADCPKLSPMLSTSPEDAAIDTLAHSSGCHARAGGRLQARAQLLPSSLAPHWACSQGPSSKLGLCPGFPLRAGLPPRLPTGSLAEPRLLVPGAELPTGNPAAPQGFWLPSPSWACAWAFRSEPVCRQDSPPLTRLPPGLPIPCWETGCCLGSRLPAPQVAWLPRRLPGLQTPSWDTGCPPGLLAPRS